jgi:demethylmenaquinone methyltransferase / 2-methoxy-6-polyprenyl-1,4-benzoquinol methylase
MSDPDAGARIEPHPVLPAFYGERAHRTRFVQRLFDDTAAHYDEINRIFSLGSGTRYRRQALLRAGLRPGLRTIDVAVGTGLVAREAAAVCGNPRDVIGVDLSAAMLGVARRKLGISLVQGLAEELPLASASADLLTMGYALRHVPDLAGTFREFHRVLRPGGTVLLLEIGRPTRPLARALVAAYLGRLVPLLCRWAIGARTHQLMDYYWQTIEHCVAPEVILAAMAQSGFVEVGCRVDFDLLRSYLGRKP